MSIMNLKIKRTCTAAIIPTYAKPGDAGMDMTCTDHPYMDDNGLMVYNTGLCFEIPVGHVGLLFPRSSITKYDLELANAVGVIDSGYRGELSFKFRLQKPLLLAKMYKKGDRIGQIVIIPIPMVQFIEVDELTTSERGTNGYGSSGA